MADGKDTLSKEARLGRFGFSIHEQNGTTPAVRGEGPTSLREPGKPAQGKTTGDAAKGKSLVKKEVTSPPKHRPIPLSETRKPTQKKPRGNASNAKTPIRTGMAEREPGRREPISSSDAVKSEQTKPSRNATDALSPVRVSRVRTRETKPTGKTEERVSRDQSPRKKDETALSQGREKRKTRAALDKEEEDARKRLKRRLNYVVIPPPRREQTRERVRRKKTTTSTEIPLASDPKKPAKLPVTRYTVKDATDLYIREYTRAKSKTIVPKPAATTKVNA